MLRKSDQKKFIDMSETFSSWICCQLGAREHYAIPRALHQQKQLAHLITDAWVLLESPLNWLPKNILANLRERFHPDLAQASVNAYTNSLINFEIAQRLQRTTGWECIIARNHWFQQQAVKSLKVIAPKLKSSPTLFAYSYAALELFRYAKSQGWRTVLGQIDPGNMDEKLVLAEHIKHADYQSTWEPAPTKYWVKWQEECSLADRILVNSSWSKQALEQVGISKSKIAIIPLAYEAPASARNFIRTYPKTFSKERPLRVLFLGRVLLRKGIAALLAAAEMLQHQPIEFWLVGSNGITPPPQIQRLKQIKWVGAVPRSTTAKYYQFADVFIFPTLSDGFGLTQLEAQAWRLPIIASKFCGEVVKHRVNGLILEEVTGEAIADALNICLKNTQQLEAFSHQSISIEAYSLSQIQHHLQNLAYAII